MIEAVKQGGRGRGRRPPAIPDRSTAPARETNGGGDQAVRASGGSARRRRLLRGAPRRGRAAAAPPAAAVAQALRIVSAVDCCPKKDEAIIVETKNLHQNVVRNYEIRLLIKGNFK